MLVVNDVSRNVNDLSTDGIERAGPRWAMETIVLLSMTLARIFSKLPRNIQLCMVTIAA